MSNHWQDSINNFAQAQAKRNCESNEADNNLPTPLPLHREIPDPEPFPIEALGPFLSEVTEVLKKTIQAPIAMCAQSVIAAVNLAVQGFADVAIDGRSFPVSEFFLTIGESGERKSAVDRVVLAPHRQYEKKLAHRFNEEAETYKKQKAIFDKQWSEALKNAGEQPGVLDGFRRPTEPLQPIFITEEPTYEGLVKLLAIGQPTMGLFADEGGRLIGGHSLSPENQLKTAAGLSELWDGRRISRVRGGDGNMLLYGRRVAMHVMAQPLVAAQLLGNPIVKDQGLLSRFLTSWPTSTVGTRRYRELDYNIVSITEKYAALITSILEAPLPLAEGKQNELEPRLLTISREGKGLWIAAHDKFEIQLSKGAQLDSIRGLGNKAAEHVLRLAATLTLSENLDVAELSARHVAMGIALVQYYLEEALRLHHASTVDPALDVANKVLTWVRGQSDGIFHLAQLYQYGPPLVRDKSTALKMIKILEDHHWLARLPKGFVIDGIARRDAWIIRKMEENPNVAV